jgi:hypothetical protein
MVWDYVLPEGETVIRKTFQIQLEATVTTILIVDANENVFNAPGYEHASYVAPATLTFDSLEESDFGQINFTLTVDASPQPLLFSSGAMVTLVPENGELNLHLNNKDHGLIIR